MAVFRLLLLLYSDAASDYSGWVNDDAQMILFFFCFICAANSPALSEINVTKKSLSLPSPKTVTGGSTSMGIYAGGPPVPLRPQN